jgi:O-antigen/teichoic acid export membrane protein
MDKTIKLAIKNFKFVFTAQIVVLLFGIIKALVIPSLVNIVDYGYWQIYLFYSSYVGIFMLGFNDGIYLRYGKYEYDKLPHEKIRSSLRIYTNILFIFTLICITIVYFQNSELKRVSLIFASLNIFVLGLNGVFIYILQITNQMKYYSLYSVLDKLIFIFSLVILIIFRCYRIEYLMIIDVFSKIIVVLGMMFHCKELWFGKGFIRKVAYIEYFENVSVGIKLMFAQLMGMLISGIGRMIVEYFGDIKDYAYYALSNTITNLVLVFITSISLLVYPTLKRLPEENYPYYYMKINKVLQKFIILIPFTYIITYILLPIILLQYEFVLSYINILFGVVMLQTKIQLLNSNFYNILRKESMMLKANISTVSMFVVLAAPIFYITKSILSIAVCTFIIMFWRCYSSEIYLRKQLNLKVDRMLFLEMLFIILFVCTTSVLSIGTIAVVYLFCFTIMVIINWNKIKMYLKNRQLKNMI